ncbi:MAG: hypothetical protein J7604_24380 [Sporocytophaga sp.]|uniref:hypothetical protein n=1 Tax=Sporocytophaga sp. TaxID=2231183 RepID=UPI001B163170|nr:hypothetical protein [Sporocytophaga sp.]MBO9703372.1 hypothetical protein [Sporocytophaga sp.]
MQAIQSKHLENIGWTSAVFKEHFTTINIRIDDFKKFTKEVVIPLFAEVESKNIASSFYFRLATDFWKGVTFGDIIQLDFCVSPYNFKLHLKPLLYERLNNYFDRKFLDALEVKEICDTVIQPKTDLDGFDMWDLRIISIEDYFIDNLTYIVGKKEVGIIRELSVKSSNCIINEIFNSENEEDTSEQNILDKCLLMYYPVMHSFFSDLEDMYEFSSWLVYKTLYQVKQVDKVHDLQEWKIKKILDANQYFEEQEDTFMGLSRYVLESLDNNDEFEEDWLNDWIKACIDCKDQLLIQNRKQRWPTIPFSYLDDETIFLKLDEDRYRHWQSIYFILKMVNSQLGISFHSELNLFNVIKNSLKRIVGKDNIYR